MIFNEFNSDERHNTWQTQHDIYNDLKPARDPEAPGETGYIDAPDRFFEKAHECFEVHEEGIYE